MSTFCMCLCALWMERMKGGGWGRSFGSTFMMIQLLNEMSIVSVRTVHKIFSYFRVNAWMAFGAPFISIMQRVCTGEMHIVHIQMNQRFRTVNAAVAANSTLGIFSVLGSSYNSMIMIIIIIRIMPEMGLLRCTRFVDATMRWCDGTSTMSVYMDNDIIHWYNISNNDII